MDRKILIMKGVIMKLAQRSILAFVLVTALTVGLGAADGGRWFVFAGPVLSDLSIPVVSGHKEFRLGFLAGAGYEVPLNGAISLLVQALYTTGGTHVDLSETSDMTYSGNAIVLPVLLRIKTGREAAPFLMAGGYAGWMFSPRLEIDTNETSSETTISGADVRPFLYGLAAGAGVELKLGPARLFVDVLYSYGMSNLAKTGTQKVRPSALNLRVGYWF
jgi:hypothetical protein